MLLGLCSTCAMASVGSILQDLQPILDLAGAFIQVLIAVTGVAFVGIIIWGAITLGTNRPRGLAMIAGGMVGAIVAGLAVVLVSHLTGQTITII